MIQTLFSELHWLQRPKSKIAIAKQFDFWYPSVLTVWGCGLYYTIHKKLLQLFWSS